MFVSLNAICIINQGLITLSSSKIQYDGGWMELQSTNLTFELIDPKVCHMAHVIMMTIETSHAVS